MPTYLSPGVYVEEVDSGSRPIEGVGTAVAAFVGLAEDGPFNAPTLVPTGPSTSGTSAASSRAPTSRSPSTRTSRTAAATATSSGSGRRAVGQRRRRRPQAIAAGPQAHARHLPGGRAGRRHPGGLVTVDIHGVEGEGAGGQLQTGCPPGRSGPGGVRPAEHRPRQGQRRHRGQRRLQGDPDRGDRHRRRGRGAQHRRDASACTRRRRRRPCPRRGCPPTTTSATSPSAPASPVWRRSTRSPWSACRT